MDKQALVRDIKQTFEGAGLISSSQVAQYRGTKWEATKKFLDGMEYTTTGKKKLYFVGDVAQKILEGRQI